MSMPVTWKCRQCMNMPVTWKQTMHEHASDMETDNAWTCQWHGNTQIMQEHSRIIKMMITASNNGRQRKEEQKLYPVDVTHAVVCWVYSVVLRVYSVVLRVYSVVLRVWAAFCSRLQTAWIVFVFSRISSQRSLSQEHAPVFTFRHLEHTFKCYDSTKVICAQQCILWVFRMMNLYGVWQKCWRWFLTRLLLFSPCPQPPLQLWWTWSRPKPRPAVPLAGKLESAFCQQKGEHLVSTTSVQPWVTSPSHPQHRVSWTAVCGVKQIEVWILTRRVLGVWDLRASDLSGSSGHTLREPGSEPSPAEKSHNSAKLLQ